MKAAYFHCIGGVSGDMVLGALVDAGVPLEAIRRKLSSLPVEGYSLREESDQRGGLKGTKVYVSVTGDATSRSLSDILTIIRNSNLSTGIKERSSSVFHRLAQAEAGVHRTSIEDVHFHEVGAVDAIIDIVGSVTGLELLGVERVFCSSIPLGQGTIASSHGVLPSPAPAALELLAMSKAPTMLTSETTELSTPTGVAIMTTLASFQPPTLKLEKVGYGLGAKHLETLPNALGLWLGQTESAHVSRDLLLIETNIDDMNPELYGYVMDQLFRLGARDVWFTPIQMKKDRPASMLSVLASPETEQAVIETILKETSSLGLRVTPVQRFEAQREIRRFTSSLGPIRIKLKLLRGIPVGISPEYDDCRRIALKKKMSLQEVYRIAAAEASQRFLPAHNP